MRPPPAQAAIRSSSFSPAIFQTPQRKQISCLQAVTSNQMFPTLSQAPSWEENSGGLGGAGQSCTQSPPARQGQGKA